MACVTVYGSGAIGGTVGAYLAREGHSVRFVDANRDHVTAIRERGLTISSVVPGRSGRFTVRGEAVTPDELRCVDPIALLSVKTQATPIALAVLAPMVPVDGCVVSLQNGLNGAIIADAVGPQRTVACYVEMGADYQEPGLIEHNFGGGLCLGELDGQITPRLAYLRNLLSPVGPVSVTGNIMGMLWTKIVYGLTSCATALADVTVAEAVAPVGNKALFVALMQEGVEVARALGTTLEDHGNFVPSRVFPKTASEREELYLTLDRFGSGSGKPKTGIWRDLAVRHRKTEVDWLIGDVLIEGRKHGISTPLTKRLIEMIHEIEENKRKMAWQNFEELRRTGGL